MVYIYILRLRYKKYYINKSIKYPTLDILNEKNEWLNKYKPMRIEKIFKNQDKLNVDTLVLYYMKIHGIKNVRGGFFKGF